MDRLTPLRAPLAVAALVALTLVAAARVGLGLSEVGSVGGSVAVAAARLAPNAGDAALTILVGVLVVTCFLAPEVPRRHGLAVWGVLLNALSVVATAVSLALTDVEIAGWGLVWLIPDVAVPALVGIGLLALARRGESAEVARPAALEPVPEPVAQEPEPDPELQPAWTQDTAAGAVWRTAGEAARGAPAAGWGSAQDTGWARPRDDERS